MSSQVTLAAFTRSLERVPLATLGLEAVFESSCAHAGGRYCFEQTGLFLHVLTQLGFAATGLSARVRISRPRDFAPPAEALARPRITLIDRELTVRQRDGRTDKRPLTDEPVVPALREHFLLHFPGSTRFERSLAR